MKELVERDTDREIAAQLPSWAKIELTWGKFI